MELLKSVVPWQAAQPAWVKSASPARTCAGLRRLAPSALLVKGPSGVRTALRTHSRIAVAAGTAVLLPGSVTVTFGRPAFAFAGIALRTHGAKLMLPLSPMINPWFGSLVEVSGGGSLHATAAASGPGPDTLRVLMSKSSISSLTAE